MIKQTHYFDKPRRLERAIDFALVALFFSCSLCGWLYMLLR